jgi:predicted RNase H-like nuclease (RuvC/YqgF family)
MENPAVVGAIASMLTMIFGKVFAEVMRRRKEAEKKQIVEEKKSSEIQVRELDFNQEAFVYMKREVTRLQKEVTAAHEKVLKLTAENARLNAQIERLKNGG